MVVSPQDPEVPVGSSVRLVVSVTGVGDRTAVRFSSLTPGTVTVNEDGVVWGLAVGAGEVGITSVAEPDLRSTVRVQVIP